MGKLDKVALCQIEIWQQSVQLPLNTSQSGDSRWVYPVLLGVCYSQTTLSLVIDLGLVILEFATNLFVSVWSVLLLINQSMLLIFVMLYLQRNYLIIKSSLKPHSTSDSQKSWFLLIYGYSYFNSSLKFYQFHFVLTDEGCHNSFLSMGHGSLPIDYDTLSRKWIQKHHQYLGACNPQQQVSSLSTMDHPHWSLIADPLNV